MTRTLAPLMLLACSTLPAPGTPEARVACEQLRNTIPYVETYDWDTDWARESYVLQFAEYRDALGCTDVPLPCTGFYTGFDSSMETP